MLADSRQQLCGRLTAEGCCMSQTVLCCVVLCCVVLNVKVAQFYVVLLKSDALTMGLRSVRRQSHVPTGYAGSHVPALHAKSRAYSVCRKSRAFTAFRQSHVHTSYAGSHVPTLQAESRAYTACRVTCLHCMH